MASVQSSLDADEVDLSGLIESIVDSDEEEDLAESMDVSDNLIIKFYKWCRSLRTWKSEILLI
jgi:hypothetical protein